MLVSLARQKRRRKRVTRRENEAVHGVLSPEHDALARADSGRFDDRLFGQPDHATTMVTARADFWGDAAADESRAIDADGVSL